jgi:hypothetical protein
MNRKGTIFALAPRPGIRFRRYCKKRHTMARSNRKSTRSDQFKQAKHSATTIQSTGQILGNSLSSLTRRDRVARGALPLERGARAPLARPHLGPTPRRWRGPARLLGSLDASYAGAAASRVGTRGGRGAGRGCGGAGAHGLACFFLSHDVVVSAVAGEAHGDQGAAEETMVAGSHPPPVVDPASPTWQLTENSDPEAHGVILYSGAPCVSWRNARHARNMITSKHEG